MNSIKRFKHQLKFVFDDNLHTKVWHNVADWTIIGLIIISTLEIFLSTFDGVAERYGRILHFIDIFTTIVFTIEVTLRIWAADELDPRYKGLRGRLRYCFSFYGLIDILSTYPFYLGLFVKIPVSALKVLRVARLLRVFRYMKSFRLLSSAIDSKKKELNTSLQFLFVITLILAFLLYFVEHAVQPEVYSNVWISFKWSWMKYVQDPGSIADYTPLTVWGGIISFLIGLLGIALFAVPAGLIGSGFTEAMEQEKENETIKNSLDKLLKTFQRAQDRYTKYQIVPSFVPLVDIQARMNMTEEEIINAVHSSNEYRVINLASTIPIAEHPFDRLAVEHCFINREYGCCIDRNSKVTIMSPSSIVDPLITNFAYYLAKIGGFNYISREIGDARPYESFYLPARDTIPGFQEFYKDLLSLSSRDGSWVFATISASGALEPSYPTQIHFGWGGSKGHTTFDEEGLTIHDLATAEKVLSGMEKRLHEEFNVNTDRQLYHTNNNPKLILRRLPDSANSISIRIAWSLIGWDTRRIGVAKALAEEICTALSINMPTDTSELAKKGLGFRDYKE